MPLMTATNFADFFISTRKKYLDGGKVTNLTGLQSYLYDNLTKGKADSEVLQGGSSIAVNLNVSNGPAGGFINPGDSVNRQTFNGLATAECGWAFWFGAMTWTTQEIELNKEEQLVNLPDQKRTQFRQAMHESFEQYLWTTPSYAAMEAASTTRIPYSIPAFVTDDGGLPSGFSTLMGRTWTNQGNQVETYTAGDGDGLLTAFDKMFRKLNFTAEGASAQWMDGTSWQKFLMPTNAAGRDLVNDLIRNRQGGNVMVSNQGGDLGALVSKATYAGVPFIWVPQLDTLSWANPKFYCLNTQFLHPVYHTSVYMREKDPKESEAQPDTWYADTTTWLNIVCKARHRQGIVLAG
jgi:hypothetical protein